ncbi:HAD family hydrolase [Thiolinea disciformis]|uniref:HAD family hydrolase n=1 Tax=Thiolinea disciformis TaxID=125614 RepID=UPI00037BA080|nr:HAD family hydrolase [Thiolinea disciformis]
MSSTRVFNQTFEAFLFDMDGTVLSSIQAAERIWTLWAQRHGLDVASFLPTIHGKRAIDTISQLNLPHIDAQAEAQALTLAEITDVEGIEAIAGAESLLKALPTNRWAIVTSAPQALALRRIEAAGLPVPDCLITADDVQHGKPAPDCFLLAAQRLGVDIQHCLVFEDAPAGIQAAEAAGAQVLVISATHSHLMQTPHPQIPSYDNVQLSVLGDKLDLHKVV